MASRTLHALDAENPLGSATPPPEAVRAGYYAYVATVEDQPGDKWFVASSHVCAKHLWFTWPGNSAAFRVKSGPDGADLAIIGYLGVPQNVNSVDTIVIGSGDGIFTPVVRSLRRGGKEVVVVSRESALSAALAREASEVRLVPEVA